MDFLNIGTDSLSPFVGHLYYCFPKLGRLTFCAAHAAPIEFIHSAWLRFVCWCCGCVVRPPYCVVTTPLNHNSTQKLGLTKKWLYTTTHHHHHHPPQTQCRQYLSCYWPDFDKTSKVASWEHLEQIPTIKLTFVQATFVLATFVHIRNISAVTDLILMKL